MNKFKLRFLYGLIVLLLLACNISSGVENENDSSALATIVAATLDAESQLPANTSLPTALYYLSDESGNFQVWRVDLSGANRTQVTHEAVDVSDYAINPVTGEIAYIVENNIYLIDADGNNRTSMMEGPPIEENSQVFFYRERISGVAWSPDGVRLAYGQAGLNIFDFSNLSTQHLIDNQVDDLGEGQYFPRAIYIPHSWSADGRLMLVDIGWYEGGTLGVMDLSSGVVVQLGEGIVCCQPTWGNGGDRVLVGSPYLGLLQSGLWEYAVQSGVESTLIPTTSDDGTLNFVGWPHQLANGDLLYFYNNLAAYPTGSDVLLTLVRTGPDGVSNRTQIRPESWFVYEALWTPDGSMVALVMPPLGDAPPYPRRGPIVLVDMAGNPIIPLATWGYALSWGWR